MKRLLISAIAVLTAAAAHGQCRTSFSLTTRSRFPASGSDSAVIVSPSPAQCGYYIVSVSDFITVNPSPAAGTGSATVPFHVAPNTTGVARTGTISVSDILYNVTQRADDALIPDTDFDGDGYADLVWRNSVTGQTSIWFMDHQTIKPSSGLTSLQFADNSFNLAGSGDFNHDGKADLLWRNDTTGQTILWAVNGPDVVAGSGELTTVPAPWHIVGIGDFNNDGYPDILWRNLADGENSIWLMRGTEVQIGSGALPQISDMNWKIAAVADFTADGKADILWHHESSA